MAPGTLIDALPSTPHPGACTGLDTIRALCHDLRQPLAAIQLLASVQGGVQGGAQGSEVRHRLDLILEQVLWLSQMVEGVIGEAAEDQPERVDVADLASHAVMRAQPTATCHIGFEGTDRAMATASPIALSRAVSCLLDNAVRAAGPLGQVTVEVRHDEAGIAILVTDDGPGMGHVPANNSLGLTITRALVAACGGAFELRPGDSVGMIAQILLPAMGARAMPT